MSKSIKNVPLNTPRGPMTWEAFKAWQSRFNREELRKMDLRDPQQENLYNRAATLPDLTDRIANNGQAEDQRFLNVVSSANSNSVQSQAALSATTGVATATINIAAHTLQFGAFQVSYNAGSIAGLDPETEYFVYADDPDLDGGAVTYLATEDPQEAVADNGRYRVGSIITQEVAAAGNVSAATSANPIVITRATAHGWSSGFKVVFTNMPGDFAALHNTTHTITVIDADEFSIPVNGAAFGAYTSGGTVTRVITGGYGGGGGGGDGPIP